MQVNDICFMSTDFFEINRSKMKYSCNIFFILFIFIDLYYSKENK